MLDRSIERLATFRFRAGKAESYHWQERGKEIDSLHQYYTVLLSGLEKSGSGAMCAL